jgi:hypothetical protein
MGEVEAPSTAPLRVSSPGMATRPWTCAHCGAALPVAGPEDRFVTCAYCARPSVVSLPDPKHAESVPIRARPSPGPMILIAAALAVVIGLGGAAFLLRASPGGPSARPAAGFEGSIALSLNKRVFAPGEPVVATFSRLPRHGDSFWATITGPGAPDATYGAWDWVALDATSVTLRPSEAGEYELRLLANWPRRSAHVVGRAPFSVRAAQAVPAPEPLAAPEIREGGSYRVGDTVTLRFDRPLTTGRTGEQFWVALVRTGAADPEWGTWHYVDAGATSTTLSLKQAGAFEVRLHDSYPRLSHHVVLRRRIDVR